MSQTETQGPNPRADQCPEGTIANEDGSPVRRCSDDDALPGHVLPARQVVTGCQKPEQRRTAGRDTDLDRSLTQRVPLRLGPLEYVLLGLIALGIGITIAMAILNPPP